MSIEQEDIPLEVDFQYCLSTQLRFRLADLKIGGLSVMPTPDQLIRSQVSSAYSIRFLTIVPLHIGRKIAMCVVN